MRRGADVGARCGRAVCKGLGLGCRVQKDELEKGEGADQAKKTQGRTELLEGCRRRLGSGRSKGRPPRGCGARSPPCQVGQGGWGLRHPGAERQGNLQAL